jgi:uncharacterized protein
MSVEWDRRKAAINLATHGVDFADAATALEDDRAVTVRDESRADEDRYIALCTDAMGRVLVVVYTWRGDTLRLISARFATPAERHQYFESRS